MTATELTSKTIPCTKFLAGTCTFGNACRFSHDRVPLPAGARAVRKPDGTSAAIKPGSTDFSGTDAPGVYTIDTQQRLTRLFEQRAGRALDYAQDWLLQRRTITEPGEFDARGLVDPWGNGLVPVPADNQLLVHSPGPDREFGTRDDLEMRREIIPVTVAPEAVENQIGRCHRIFCVVPLQHVAAASVVASLRSYLAERTDIAPGLKVDTVGAKGVGLLGPPEQVAILLEHVKQIDRAV